MKRRAAFRTFVVVVFSIFLAFFSLLIAESERRCEFGSPEHRSDALAQISDHLGTSMDMSSRMALRVGDLFNAQAAEKTYQRLVDFLNQQALETQRLHAHLRELEAKLSATDEFAAASLDQKLAQVDDRLARLEQRAQQQHERHCSADERVNQVERAAIDAARERKEIRAEAVKLEHSTTKTIFQSESARIEALVTKISAFAPKSDQLVAKLAELDSQQVQIVKTLDASERRWEIHQQQFSRVEAQVTVNATQASSFELSLNESIAPQLSDHRERIQQLDEAIGSLSTKSSANEAAQRTLSAKFHSVATAFTEQFKQQSERFQALINERARSVEVSKQFAKIQSELNSKAPWDALQRVADEVSDLGIQCSELEKHVQLSSRFMDWFATRGEAYEHNLEVVETQLGQIALNSRPEIREPFGEQVRYPHT